MTTTESTDAVERVVKKEIAQEESEKDDARAVGINHKLLFLVDERKMNILSITSYLSLVFTTGGVFIMRNMGIEKYLGKEGMKRLEQFFTVILFFIWCLMLASESVKAHVRNQKDKLVEKSKKNNEILPEPMSGLAEADL